jgi:pimeloyl-ACP methyl ester carboxylesterase
MTTVAESRTFDTGEVILAYSEWPGASPPVVALHGISGTRSLIIIESRGDQRAFAYDHRGHGDSGRTPGAYTFVNYGRDVIAFLRGVVGEPALLIGHSLGAMASIYAAAHAPNLVRAAFLADPPLYAPEGPLRDERGPFAAVAEQAGKPVDELVAAGVPPPRAEAIAKLDPGVLRMTVDQSAFDGWDTDSYLRAIECPVVLEHGDRDLGSAIYPGELERASALVSRCTVLRIADTGHAAWVTKKDEWDAALQSFIQQHSS